MSQGVLDFVTIRIAGLVHSSTVDGDGLRYSIFVQGCPHECLNCQNPETWDINGGTEMKVNDILRKIDVLPDAYDGITLTGGEPFEQEDVCLLIARQAHIRGFTVWTYTGYEYEFLRFGEVEHPLVFESDVIVCGPYVEALKTDEKYIGSSNQRILRSIKSWKNLHFEGVKTEEGWTDVYGRKHDSSFWR